MGGNKVKNEVRKRSPQIVIFASAIKLPRAGLLFVLNGVRIYDCSEHGADPDLSRKRIQVPVKKDISVSVAVPSNLPPMKRYILTT